MPPPSRSELTGVLLLGIALFVLALSLRGVQPGVLALPDYACPAGAAGLYAIAALLLAGFRVQALIVLGLMWSGHVVYAFLMGCAFAMLVNGGPPSALDALHEGLSAYPPAVLLQVTFVIPAVSVLAWPWLPRRDVDEEQGFAAVDNARSCRELAQGILSVEAVEGARAEAALASLARRARALLSEEARAGSTLTAGTDEGGEDDPGAGREGGEEGADEQGG